MLLSVFKKLFNDKLFTYTSFFIAFLFVEMITGLETFNRYGILVLIACLFAYIFFSHKEHLFHMTLFLIGVLVGIIFPFFNDQAVYSIFLFLFMIIADKIIKKELREHRTILKEICVFLAGVFIADE